MRLSEDGLREVAAWVRRVVEPMRQVLDEQHMILVRALDLLDTAEALQERCARLEARLERKLLMDNELTFAKLRTQNLSRVNGRVAFPSHDLLSWSLTDWACAAAGEMGELCNIVKKIHRGMDYAQPGDGYNDMADEIADTVIYLDLLAARAGIDMGEAVRRKFNAVSVKRGAVERL